MLKFLRKHTKLLLVVFGTFLMLIFLLPTGADLFRPSPQTEAVGHFGSSPWLFGVMGGQAVQRRDLAYAGVERGILSQINPFMSERSPDPEADNNLRWILLVRAASEAGLYATEGEVSQFLAEAGIDEERLTQLSRSSGLAPEGIREAVRKWIIVQQYKSMAMGLAQISQRQPINSLDRLAAHQEAFQSFMSLRQQFGDNPQFLPLIQQQVEAMLMSVRGQPRMSGPMLRHAVVGQRARVRIEMLPVSVERYLRRIDEAPEPRIRELFEQYKDDLPGEGRPYRFGYKYPDRVRIEAISVPRGALLEAVTVEDVEAYAYYHENPQRFLPEPPPGQNRGADEPPREPIPWPEARPQAEAAVRREKADNLGMSILRRARQQLRQSIEQMPLEGGYYALNASWQPEPFSELVQGLRERFGVPVELISRRDRWLDRGALSDLKGLGQATIVGAPAVGAVPFPDYALSVHELHEDVEPIERPLASLQFQVGAPSHPMRGPDGGYYLFRVIGPPGAPLQAVSPEHPPESLEEVRPQVAFNARQVLAFERMTQADELEQWRRRARTEGLNLLAESMNRPTIQPGPFARRDFRGNLTQVQGVGQSEKFLNEVFERALSLSAELEDDQSIQDLPRERRLLTVALEQRLRLYLVRIDGFESMSREAFEQEVQNPVQVAQLGQLLMMPPAERTQRRQWPLTVRAFSVETLSEVTDYTSYNQDDG